MPVLSKRKQHSLAHGALYVGTLTAPAGITLDPAKTTSHISLDGTKLIATSITGIVATDSSRGSAGASNVRHYFEAKLDLAGSASPPVGAIAIGDTSFAMGTQIGTDTHAFAFYTNNIELLNNVNMGTWFDQAGFGNFVSGTTIQVAVDLKTPRKMWVRRATADTAWNANVNAFPNGIGGIDISSLSGNLFPFIGTGPNSDGSVWTMNFGATAFIGTMPTGYVKWGDAEAGATLTWDASAHDAHVAISGGNKVATFTSGISSAEQGRSATGHSSGKWYAKFQLTADPVPGTTNTGIGFLSSAFTPGSGFVGSNANGVGAYRVGVFLNSGSIGSIGGTVAPGDFVEVCLDIASGGAWWRRTGDDWNDNASADPATGTGAIAIASIVANLPVYLCVTSASGAGDDGVVWTIVDGTPPGGGFSHW